MSPIEFVTTEPIDLSNCDREPIHIPGKIQPHGVLLVLQEPQLTILQVSANTEAFFGISPESLLGQDLSVIFCQENLQFLTHCIFENELEYFNPFQLPTSLKDGQFEFEGVLHRTVGSLLCLELEPKLSGKNTYPLSFYHLLKASIAKIFKANNFQEATNLIAAEVRQLTGYDRVMIYRFARDESGVVVAESCRGDLEPFLGLHYPASDIPKQARKLYYQNWLRLIVDVNYQPVEIIPQNNPLTDEPLDLSLSTLRSVSPIHVEYLQNMGVRATLTISLLDEERLWGLICCHHYQPKYVDYETRKACEFLGQFMSVEFFKQQQKDLGRYQSKVAEIQERLNLSKSANQGAIAQKFQQNESAILELVNARSAAIALEDDLILLGKTPPVEAVQHLLEWLRTHHREKVFHTDCLGKIYPPSRDYQTQMSGILAISIFLENTCYQIVWFRPEIVQTVKWGGNPHKPVTVDEENGSRLSPRKSFELWKETVSGKSLPWNKLEIEAALNFRNALMLAVLEFSQAALEEAAKRAEVANQVKSEFLANMSHEIRTPMNAILGFCDLMQGLVSEPRQQAYLDSIATSGKSLLALINDILDLSKIEAGKLQLHYEPTNLRELIREIQQIFSQQVEEKGLSLYAEIDENLPIGIDFDEVRLRQILFNVVGNALKFTEAGYIKISVRCQPYVSEGEGKIWMEIAVEDTGIGISGSDREKIFDAFIQSEGQSTRKYGGTGLGLAITRRLTTMLGGELVVNSEVGTGSTFSFVFPDIYRANWEPEAHEKKPMDENLEQFQPATILVVDNVESNRTLIAEYFANTHHRLLFAKDGREAIEMAQIHQPDVILLDLRMPNLDGRSAAIFLKQDPQTRDIPIIVLTASVAKDELQDMQLFCQGFLRKPVKRFQLVEAFKNILPLNENSPREREVQPPAASAREPMMETPGENLSELAEKLALEEQNQWQQLRQTMKRREVKAFAKRLHAWAREYHCAKLEAYATKISHQLGEFDWENLPATLEEFPQLRQWLEGNGDRA